TACGKSALACELAGTFNAEIVSADSVQVYRSLDIGSAKPTPEQRRKIAHHLVDVVEPDEDYTAARFADDAQAAVSDILSRDRNVFVVGGTGLYIKALLGGLFAGPGADASVREELLEFAQASGTEALYERLKEADPEAAKRTHPNNVRRVVRALEVFAISNKPISEFQAEHGFSESRYDALKIGINVERKELCEAIDRRVDEMIVSGLVDEVRVLIERYDGRIDGAGPGLKSMGSLGYKEIARYLSGGTGLSEAIAEIKKNTRRYAKRQMTWFRKDTDIKWYSSADKTGIIARIRRHLS
ncbi:MAG: tRNA (adenosine(37)-N6)-dimethylallyltransferase MiaA, partial [Nitrospirota bacterium]|nr:tRNA (adenosine(37)-N6)-dimethylallyltransferase MiaA [Nitrospirota bacterium]